MLATLAPVLALTIAATATPPSDDRAFCAGTTKVTNAVAPPIADDALPPRERPTPPPEPHPGTIALEVTPARPATGETYTLRAWFSNDGPEGMTIRSLIVAATRNGRRVQAPVPPRVTSVPAGARELVLSVDDLWPEGVRDWAIELTVVATGDRGRNTGRYSNRLDWCVPSPPKPSAERPRPAGP